MPEIRTIYQDFNIENLSSALERFRERELFVGVVVSHNNQIRRIAESLELGLHGYEMVATRNPLTLTDTYRVINDNGNELVICSDDYYRANPRLERIANVVIWDDMRVGPNPQERGYERIRFEAYPNRRTFADRIYERGARTPIMVDGNWAIDPGVIDRFNEVVVPPIPQPELDELLTQLNRQFYTKSMMSMIFDDEDTEELQDSPELDAYLEEMSAMKA